MFTSGTVERKGGARAGRREEGGEHKCGGAAYTDFADVVNFWGRVSGIPGEGGREP